MSSYKSIAQVKNTRHHPPCPSTGKMSTGSPTTTTTTTTIYYDKKGLFCLHSGGEEQQDGINN
jgi:hypothetical protein